MLYELSGNKLKIKVDSVGAELVSIQDQLGIEYIWEGYEPYWTSHTCNLFPFCGRVVGGKYFYQDREYPMTKHGFVRKMNFKLNESKSSEQKLIFEINDTPDTYKMYPFHFCFSVSYEIIDNSLICKDEIYNLDSKELIYSVGAHPGFRVPLKSDETFEDYTVDFGENSLPKLRILSDNYFDTGKSQTYPLYQNRFLPLKHSLFDNDALFFESVNNQMSIINRATGNGVKVTSQDAIFWGLWHNPGSTAPFVCIEPWFGFPGIDGIHESLEKKPFTNRIMSNNLATFQYNITIF